MILMVMAIYLTQQIVCAGNMS